MNTVLKIFTSMSFSGALLILVLFIGKRFLRDKVSRQWQYYIWLIVILRLLLPFRPEINLMGKIYYSPDSRMEFTVSGGGIEENNKEINSPKEDLGAEHPVRDRVSALTDYIWLIWSAVAMAMLIRKITVYQSFTQYINCGSTPVSDIEILNRFSTVTELAGVKRPVELSMNPLVSSPLLTGFFKPCIVLPGKDISEKELEYIILHELTHYKRRDMFYKWLVQITVCLHWFNPFVYLMSQEINRACEFSCDEAVLLKVGCQNAQDYGKTLLDAMASVGKYRESLGAVTLNENKQLLKERLTAIMTLKEKSKATKILTSILTVCIILGALLIGVYPVNAASDQKASMESGIAECYEAGSLPLFQIAFSRLSEEAQWSWLDKIYADGEIAFLSVSVDVLDTDSPLIGDFAEKFYEDGSVSFFSALTKGMSVETMELWLDRALEDGKSSFQSVLLEELEKDDGKNALGKELEQKQLEEYEAAGVTKDGRDYYYQGQLVNIFLDPWPGKPYYTLNLNPKGTVNVKIDRGEDGEITGVSYMTDAEAAELFNK